jgi:hypothetical protein
VRLKTPPSPDRAWARKHRCSTGGHAALVVLCAGLAAFAGCGGGELSGQSADAPATVATTQSPTVATTPQTTSPTGTTPQTTPRTTTTPATTTAPPATTPTTTAAQPPATTAEPAPDPGREIVETAQLVLEEKISAIEYRQRGTVTGTYDGTMALHAKIGQYIFVRFTVTVPGGTVSGRARATIEIAGESPYPIRGTAAISGGTGRFEGVRGHGLEVDGRAAIDGTRGTVRLRGTVFFD